VGGLNETGKGLNAGDVKRDLLKAILLVAQTGKGPAEQIQSMGCSIK